MNDVLYTPNRAWTSWTITENVQGSEVDIYVFLITVWDQSDNYAQDTVNLTDDEKVVKTSSSLEDIEDIEDSVDSGGDSCLFLYSFIWIISPMINLIISNKA